MVEGILANTEEENCAIMEETPISIMEEGNFAIMEEGNCAIMEEGIRSSQVGHRHSRCFNDLSKFAI